MSPGVGRPPRRLLRLRNHDYSQPGAYFIMLVSHGRVYLFGEAVDGSVRISVAGKTVWDACESIPERYPAIAPDVAVVMPDHIHTIL